ncbi:MAG: extensin family protein [Pseudomonadota bacterium]
MRWAALCCALLLLTGPGFAAAPEASLRPVERGGPLGVRAVALAPSGAIRPPERNEIQNNAVKRGGLFASLRPAFRSAAAVREGRKAERLKRRGAVCDDVSIQGEIVGRVTGRLPGCLIENAVRVREVAGIRLSQRAVMDCPTAAAFKTWLETAAKPAFARKGGGLQSVRVAAHYACRTRNNQKGARLSEHGKGRAIDVSGFRLSNGTEVSVLQGWNAPAYSKAMRQVHRQACGPFGTVLGPNANRFHRDHFHFDTARYRSGPYCR